MAEGPVSWTIDRNDSIRGSQGRLMPNRSHEPATSDVALTLRVLGEASLWFRTRDGDSSCVLGAGKPLALITYLLRSPGRAATRDHLVDLLWADHAPAAARHALRQAVWYIRQRIGSESIETSDGSVKLAIEVHSDVEDFLGALEQSELERAVELYAGPFLPDLAVPGGAEFEHWANSERTRLDSLFVRSAESLARRWLSEGKPQQAERLARRLVQTHRLREAGWRLLLETLASEGDTVRACAEADELEGLLAAEGRDGEPATREAIRLARRLPAEVGAADGRSELAAELVGREREFASIVCAWERARSGSGSHVAIVAVAGLGKTRLLQDTRSRLRATGATVVHVRANHGERHISYAFASSLARSLVQLPGALAVPPACTQTLVALNPSLSSWFNTTPESSREPETLRRRTIALQELLAAVADESALALLIDDLHWMDDASRSVLAAVAASIDDKRVLLVTTARPMPHNAVADEAGEVLTLPALTHDQVSALLGSIGRLPEADWAHQLPDLLERATNGSPLLIMETLQLALDRGQLVLEAGEWSCTDREALERELAAGGALKQRLARLERDENWLLLLLAVAGYPLSIGELARMTERFKESLDHHLANLERGGFVSRVADAFEPAHDEIARSAMEIAKSDALSAANGAIGRVILDTGWNDSQSLTRAGRYLAAGGDDSRLDQLLKRRIWLGRAEGDFRSVAEVARELLGDHSSGPTVRRLVRRLPLYMRLGITTRARVMGLVAACAALLAVSGFTWWSALRSRPDAVLLLYDSGYRTEDLVGAVELKRNGWVSGQPLHLHRGRKYALPDLDGVYAGVYSSPTGHDWAFSRLTPDSGGIDLFLISDEGVETRLTWSRGDDKTSSWAPDGSRLVISTGRWHRRGVYDLALLDPVGGEVRRFTGSPVHEGRGVWSPDGTRIAFVRTDENGAFEGICWKALDGERASCLPGVGRAGLFAWISNTRILTADDSSGREWISLADVTTGSIERLIAGSKNLAVSPDGRWVTCFCDDPDAGDRGWLVFPASEPNLRRRIAIEHDTPEFLKPAWRVVTIRKRYLDRLEIQEPHGPIPLGVPHQLRAAGYDPSDSSLTLHALSWRSKDTSVATVTSDGIVLGRRTGKVTFVASAGGWRSDSITIGIERPSHETVFAETWEDGSLAEWTLYGDPRPGVSPGPGDVYGFETRGDGSFASGAYTRRTWDAGAGLGLELQVSTPITEGQGQVLYVFLGTWDDTLRVANWDHRTGWFPMRDTELAVRKCGAAVPRRTTESDDLWMSISPKIPGLDYNTARDPTDASWYTLRLQIFPDGTCGMAVNGMAVARTSTQLPLDHPYRVLAEGNSVDTKILVGPLHVWTGIRDDVDWTRVMPGEVLATSRAVGGRQGR